MVREGFLFDLGIEEELAAFLCFARIALTPLILGEKFAPILVMLPHFLEFIFPLFVVIGRLDLGFGFFEERIMLKFLLEQGTEFEGGGLQEMQRLLHLRGQSLTEPQILL
jgi:hypothetical protein